MDRTSFDWGVGVVLHWDMDSISAEVPIDMQKWELKEDLAQIVFPGNVVLDIGWFPEFDVKGSFVVTVAQNQEWDNPLFEESCKDLQSLTNTLAVQSQRFGSK